MSSEKNKAALVVPCLNAGKLWKNWIEAFNKQTYKPEFLLVIDSSSEDRTAELALENGFEVNTISRSEFNHGGTRQLGVEFFPEREFIIFLTQDAILANPRSLEYLMAQFEDPDVGMAYGRQIPHLGATPIAAHARYFNYPSESRQKSTSDIPELGIKTAFCSNSFAAYRYQTLQRCGGFPSHTIFGEDTYIASKMLIQGWKIAYCSEAAVYHSHNYTIMEETKRYFDIGALHSTEPWILEVFGNANREGLKFVGSEFRFCLPRYFYLIPVIMIRAITKLLGYKLGQNEKYIPKLLKKKLSMNYRYWDN
jgi:rhamnosyltransferase